MHSASEPVPAFQQPKQLRKIWVSQSSILRTETLPVPQPSGPCLGKTLQATLKFKAMQQSCLCFHGTSKATSSFVLRRSFRSVLLSFLKLKPSLFYCPSLQPTSPRIPPDGQTSCLPVRPLMQMGCLKHPN